MHRASRLRFFDGPDTPFVDEDMIELLLDAGSNVSIQDRNGRTPLRVAARSGETAVVALQLLLDAGSNVKTKDKIGQTALHKVARYRFDENERFNRAAELLLERGSEMDVKDRNGMTALDLARKAGREGLVTTLVEWEQRSRGLDILSWLLLASIIGEFILFWRN